MSTAVRSTKGCWTCRLRKKKCDETRPACSICANLDLTCHGYGPKPEWMDGSRREREVVESVRRLVKETTCQKKRKAMLQKQRRQWRSPVQSIAEEACGKAAPEAMLPLPAPSNQSQGSYELHKTGYPDLAAAIEQPGPIMIAEEEHSSLLMHYLDHVFPLQFHFYKPSISEGGRGWLLTILLHNKPLYHAALSLAAYHRESLVCHDIGNERQGFALEKLQQQFARAIKELRQYLNRTETSTGARTLVENVELLCCITLLISIEAFKGASDGTWRIHLSAASALFQDIKNEGVATAEATLTPDYKAAIFFFAGVLAWYDILSYCTTGATPFSHCECLNAMGYVSLETIMGCENWAILCIMDIDFLEDWKRQVQLNGRLSMRELVCRSSEIERRLEEGLHQNSEPWNSNLQGDSVGNDPSPLVPLVTRIFACSALVYLHVVVSGSHPELHEIRQSVSRTVSALRAVPDKGVISSLTWPFCISGCMAMEEDWEFFRSLAVEDGAGSSKFGNSSKALAVMEECWRLRKNEAREMADWGTAMDSLGINLLLV